MSYDVKALVATLKGVLPARTEFAALHEPEFAGNEWTYVKECLDTGWVSSVGQYVDQFERMLCEITGAAYAVAVANGTAALHVCLLLAGVERQDEVLIPSLTFIATANAVSYIGAIPHFVDSEYTTLGVDPVKLDEYLASIAEIRAGVCYNRQTGRVIRAIMPMHTFGHPVRMDELEEVAGRWRLAVVEDAAEALGSRYKGRPCGTFGKLAGLSFNGNKIVTTGGGGAILTNDVELGRQAKHLTTTARVPHKWSFLHDAVGFNYRMPNLNAALGCAQLEHLGRFLEQKRALAEQYAAAVDASDIVTFVREPEDTESNYWLNALLIVPEMANRREEVLQALNDAGLQARPVWTLIHTLPMYTDCPRMDLRVAQDIERRLINIPSSPKLVSA